MRTVIIDGGGSTTDVGLAIDGVCVARTSLPSVKPTATVPRTEELCRMLGSFLATTSVSPDIDITSALDGVIIGMAGIWTQAEIHRYQTALHGAWETYVGNNAPNIVVMSDAELVLHGAFGKDPGMVLIAGTGSIALSRDAFGALHRCGGWGPRIDDAGGGFWLGHQACKAVAHMLDGRGAKTLLIRPVAAYVRADADDLESVRVALRGASIDGVARIGSAVLTYADEGDVVASYIRTAGATALAELVRGLQPSHDQHVVAYGSLWHNAAYLSAVENLCDCRVEHMNDLLPSVANRLV
ncbi:MAG: hypothetical protein H7X70_04355 [Candidatus Kapabacteria bacterium]|nr:hypothetical protein [Candidatus Kapabacteria bacterium]